MSRVVCREPVVALLWSGCPDSIQTARPALGALQVSGP